MQSKFGKGDNFMIKRLFKGALLETILLNIINNESQNGVHGYAIFTTIKRKFGVRLGPSTLYPELRLLESHGLVEASWDLSKARPRKRYTITKEGRNLLAEYSAELKVVVPTPISAKQGAWRTET